MFLGTLWQYELKTLILLSYELSIPYLSIYFTDIIMDGHKDVSTRMFISSK